VASFVLVKYKKLLNRQYYTISTAAHHRVCCVCVCYSAEVIVAHLDKMKPCIQHILIT